MTDFPRFDRDTLYNYVYDTLEKTLGDAPWLGYLTDQVCDAVIEWVPKQGDFWLEEESGTLYVNKGWEIVTVDGIE